MVFECYTLRERQQADPEADACTHTGVRLQVLKRRHQLRELPCRHAWRLQRSGIILARVVLPAFGIQREVSWQREKLLRWLAHTSSGADADASAANADTTNTRTADAPAGTQTDASTADASAADAGAADTGTTNTGTANASAGTSADASAADTGATNTGTANASAGTSADASAADAASQCHVHLRQGKPPGARVPCAEFWHNVALGMSKRVQSLNLSNDVCSIDYSISVIEPNLPLPLLLYFIWSRFNGTLITRCGAPPLQRHSAWVFQ